MTCLVIGGTGFVGTALAEALRRRGATVTAAGRVAPSGGRGWMRCDVTDPAALRNVLTECQPDVIVNLIGASNEADACRVHLIGTGHLIAAMRTIAPKAKLIAVGSAAEYGISDVRDTPLDESAPCLPVSGYGFIKLASTQLTLALAADWDLDVTVVRPFNIIGAGCPDRLFLGALIQRLVHAPTGDDPVPIRMGRLDTVRDFIAVDDVVQALVGLAEADRLPGIFNVCTGQPVRMGDLAALVAARAGRAVRWEIDPGLIRPDDPAFVVGSGEKLRRATGFEPRVPVSAAIDAAWTAALDAASAASGEGRTR